MPKDSIDNLGMVGAATMDLSQSQVAVSPWHLVQLISEGSQEDGSILVIFEVTNDVDTETPNMVLPGDTPDFQIDVKIQEYIDNLNGISPEPPPLSTEQLDDLDTKVTEIQNSIQDVQLALDAVSVRINDLRDEIQLIRSLL